MTGALQAIVFDFDGVIADSEPLHLRAFQQALAEERIELTATDYYSQYLGYDDVGLLQALAADRRIEMGEREMTALLARKAVLVREMLEGGQLLFPGAADFIRAAAAVVPIAIASGAMRHEIEAIIGPAGVRDLFSAIVSSGDTPQSKPSPAPYRLAFERLCQASGRVLDRRRSVAVEDSRWGLESARGAGLRCVAVTTSYPAAELAGAELVVDGLNTLTLSALERLCANHHA